MSFGRVAVAPPLKPTVSRHELRATEKDHPEMLMALLVLIALGQSVDRNRTDAPEATLELSFEMDPAALPLDGGFIYRQTIKNVSQESIYLGSCITSWSIRDLDTGVTSSWSGFTDEPKEAPRREHMIRLEPGHSSGSVLGAVVPIQFLVNSPGRYELEQTCSPEVDWEEHEGVRVWNKHDEPLSATFEFEVIE